MKNLLVVFAALLIILSSCNKDEDCVAGDLDTNIVGTWDVIAVGTNTGQVEFKANGDLVDPDDALIGGESGGQPFDIKTYVVSSNSLLTLKAENNLGGSVEYDLDITNYDCDKIEFELLGFTGSLNRD